MIQQDHYQTDEETLAYRSMSNQAVIGLVLALVSPVAFFGQLLLLIPFAAAVLSAAAALSIARSPETLTGQWAALLGLFLSVTVAAAVYSRDLARTNFHVTDASNVESRFLEELSEGDFLSACELMVEFNARQHEGPTLQDYYNSNEQAKERLEAFISNTAVQALAEPYQELKLISQSTPQRYKGGRVYFQRIYEIESADEVKYVSLSFERSPPRSGSAAWRVADCKLDQHPS